LQSLTQGWQPSRLQAAALALAAGCLNTKQSPVNGMSGQWLYILCIPLVANNRANQAQLAAVCCHCAPTPAYPCFLPPPGLSITTPLHFLPSPFPPPPSGGGGGPLGGAPVGGGDMGRGGGGEEGGGGRLGGPLPGGALGLPRRPGGPAAAAAGGGGGGAGSSFTLTYPTTERLGQNTWRHAAGSAALCVSE